ncbi:hypothetical protein ACIPY2_07735 [Paenarthrobacter sp. NPDC089675]
MSRRAVHGDGFRCLGRHEPTTKPGTTKHGITRQGTIKQGIL